MTGTQQGGAGGFENQMSTWMIPSLPSCFLHYTDVCGLANLAKWVIFHGQHMVPHSCQDGWDIRWYWSWTSYVCRLFFPVFFSLLHLHHLLDWDFYSNYEDGCPCVQAVAILNSWSNPSWQLRLDGYQEWTRGGKSHRQMACLSPEAKGRCLPF